MINTDKKKKPKKIQQKLNLCTLKVVPKKPKIVAIII